MTCCAATSARPTRAPRASSSSRPPTASCPGSPNRSRGRRPARSRSSASRRSPATPWSASRRGGRDRGPRRRREPSRRAPRSGPPASRPPSLAAKLAGEAGIEVDRAGRIPVELDLTLPGHPEVLALGDMVRVQRATDGRPLPGSRRSQCSRAATRRALIAGAPARPRAGAVPLRRQGQPRHHRALEGRRRREGPPLSRLPGVGACGCSSTRVPDRLPEPAARPPPLDDQLPHPRTGRAPDRSPANGQHSADRPERERPWSRYPGPTIVRFSFIEMTAWL